MFNDTLELRAPVPSVAESEPVAAHPTIADGRIAIAENVLFEFDSARLLESSHAVLDAVAKVMRENPDVQKIEVRGHASAEGRPQYNLQLSQRRAQAVVRYLAARGNIRRDRLAAKGYGDAQPIASNDTDEGREKNRRVEFVIVD